MESKPVLGKPSFTAKYENATYRFSSANNRDMFAAKPYATPVVADNTICPRAVRPFEKGSSKPQEGTGTNGIFRQRPPEKNGAREWSFSRASRLFSWNNRTLPIGRPS